MEEGGNFNAPSFSIKDPVNDWKNGHIITIFPKQRGRSEPHYHSNWPSRNLSHYSTYQNLIGKDKKAIVFICGRQSQRTSKLLLLKIFLLFIFYRSMMCLDNSESNPNFIWGVLYFFPLRVSFPCVVPLISRQSHFLSVWWKGYINLLRPTTFLLSERGKINYGFYIRIIGRPIRDKKIPYTDTNSTGNFLSPRRLGPIFTCLTAFNCKKIYTIGKPTISSIC